jgi:nucleoside-diphosphate-sugar epimerase
MRVFVTGATGHIGSALVPELTAAGHQVTALARSDASAAAAERLGARVRRGDMEDLDALRRGAEDADGIIHLAFPDEMMRAGDLAAAGAVDLAADRALGEAIEGTGKPFVAVTGMLVLAALGPVGAGQTRTEEDTVSAGPRADSENYVIGLAGRGVRSSVVRLSPMVHSPERGKAGFATVMITIARRAGISSYIGDGANRWSAVHTTDASRLLRLALENAPAGTRLHAVGDEAVTLKEIATVIGAHLGLPVASVAPEEAAGRFGPPAGMLQADVPASSAITRKLLGWDPTGPGILADLRDDRLYH